MNLDTFSTALTSLQRRVPTGGPGVGAASSEVVALLARCAAAAASTSPASEEDRHALCACLLHGGEVVDDGSSGGGARQPLQSARCWEVYALGALLLKELLQPPITNDDARAALTHLALASVPGLLAHSEPRLRKLCGHLVFLLAQVRAWDAQKTRRPLAPPMS